MSWYSYLFLVWVNIAFCFRGRKCEKKYIKKIHILYSSYISFCLCTVWQGCDLKGIEKAFFNYPYRLANIQIVSLWDKKNIHHRHIITFSSAPNEHWHVNNQKLCLNAVLLSNTCIVGFFEVAYVYQLSALSPLEHRNPSCVTAPCWPGVEAHE